MSTAVHYNTDSEWTLVQVGAVVDSEWTLVQVGAVHEYSHTLQHIADTEWTVSGYRWAVHETYTTRTGSGRLYSST